jgi:hypothetical protein
MNGFPEFVTCDFAALTTLKSVLFHALEHQLCQHPQPAWVLTPNTCSKEINLLKLLGKLSSNKENELKVKGKWENLRTR